MMESFPDLTGGVKCNGPDDSTINTVLEATNDTPYTEPVPPLQYVLRVLSSCFLSPLSATSSACSCKYYHQYRSFIHSCYGALKLVAAVLFSE
jgi:hypothetical protein